jgi:hypothetical protein
MDLQMLKDIQDNGGIMLSILVVGLIVGAGATAVRALDWRSWRKELKQVARIAASDVGQHEINFHEDEILHKVTVERLAELKNRLEDRIKEKKESRWTGEERRAQ